MQNTPNYNLKKPDYEDFADIVILNENSDIIDERLKSNADQISSVNSTVVDMESDVEALKIQTTETRNQLGVTQSYLSTVGNALNEHVFNMAQHNQFMEGNQKKQLIFGINRQLNCLTIEEVDIDGI